MKKNLIKLFAIAVGISISVTTAAQQAEEKPKVADRTKFSDKEKTKPTDAAIAKEVAEQKPLTANDKPKPIVPGGEHKPLDTQKGVLLNDKKQATEPYQPIIPPVSTTGAKRPEVVEQNAPDASQQKAKPVPQVLKEQ